MIALALGLLASAFIASRPTAAVAQQVWFGAVPSVLRQHKGWAANDWMELFQNNAPWPQGFAHIQAFLVPTQFVVASSDRELATVLTSLQRHHVALAMAGLMLTGSERCGRGVEGYDSPRGMERAALRIRRLGGVLQYVIMDEPLFYGHDSDRGRVCHDSIASIASQVAAKVSRARSVFPQVQVGDVEPLATIFGAGWATEIRAWFAAYQAAVGAPLAFFDLDINWGARGWPRQLLSVAATVRAARVPLGIVYNGSPHDQSDQAWTESAEGHYRYIESSLRIVPDYAIIDSWMRYPREMLPENAPGTMANLLLGYLQWRTR